MHSLWLLGNANRLQEPERGPVPKRIQMREYAGRTRAAAVGMMRGNLLTDIYSTQVGKEGVMGRDPTCLTEFLQPKVLP